MHHVEDLGPLMQRWFDQVWNAKNADALDELLAPDCRAHGIESGKILVGPGEFREFHAGFCGAFPDLKFTVDDFLQDGNKTAVRFSATGTYAGGLPGDGLVGNEVSLTGQSICHWKDGQIVEGWNNYDELQVLVQIGAVPLPE
jgi:predicted ester cyclase